MPPWLVILLGLVFLYVVRDVLPPFFIAGMLAYILVPAVEAADSTSPHVRAGMTAVQKEDWSEAWSQFHQALRAVPPPASPDLIFDTALAADRAGGRELQAAALYRTFLAAAPTSPRAPLIRQRIRDYKQRGANLIKLFASQSIRDGGAPTMTAAQLNAACGEAHAQGLRVLVHAHAAEAVKLAASLPWGRSRSSTWP